MRGICGCSGPVLTALVVLIIASSAIAGGGINFGDPVVVDGSLGPVPIGDFPSYASLRCIAQSDNYILMLVGTPAPGVWSMVRLTHNGALVDTVPRQMRPLDYAYSGGTPALTWEAPYFYVWEIDAGGVFYTRLTEDLALVDQARRRIGPVHGPVAFGGSQYWSLSFTGMRTVWGYDATTDSAIVQGDTIPGWRYLTGVESTRRLVHNGFYVVRYNPLDTLAECAYISPSGEVAVLAPGRGHPFVREAAHYAGDSAIFYEADSEGESLRYFFLAPSDSLSPVTVHELALPALYYGHSKGAFLKGPKGVVFGYDLTVYYQWYWSSIDLIAGTASPPALLPIASSLDGGPGSAAAVFAGQTCLTVFSGSNGLRLLSFAGPDYEAVTNKGPVLFGLGHESQPSVAVDSPGVTVYAVEGRQQGTRLKYHRWEDWSPAGLAAPVTAAIEAAGSGVYSPAILPNARGSGALYWLDQMEDAPGVPSRLYEQHLALLSGDEMTQDEADGAVLLDTSAFTYFPPDAIQLGDSLYVISGVGETWYLRTIDLVSGERKPGDITALSIAPPKLFRDADSLIRWGEYYMCLEDCGNVGCCVFSRHTYGREYFGGAPIDYWQNGLPGVIEYDWPYPVRGAHYFAIGGEHFIALTEYTSILQIDLSVQASTMAADLTGQLSSALAARDDVELLPATVGDYRVVIALRTDRRSHDAFVFDDAWNMVARTTISPFGCVDDVGGLVNVPGTDTLLLVYSTWLPYPYSSERLVVQKVWLDPTTGIGDDDPPVPTALELYPNYPNPFNAGTIIRFALPQRSTVTLEVFDILGRLVYQSGPAMCGAGRHALEWDGRDRQGDEAATGVYLYRVTAGDQTLSRKMLLLR